MLKNLVECKVSASFIIIEDREDTCGVDLFKSFLANFDFESNPKTKVNLICYENPPEFYLSSERLRNEKVIAHNYFSDPVGWKNSSTPKTDLSVFTSSNCENLSENVFFIDSISLLTHYHGFCSVYRNLSVLKKFSKKLICFLHGDVIFPEQIEELHFLSNAVVSVRELSSVSNCDERLCEVIFKKSGGKVVKEEEFFSVGDDFRTNCRIKEIEKVKSVSSVKGKSDMESLTTFKLGINMSEKEKKAKEELVLPYLKTESQSQTGGIIYEPDVDEIEDDPDDDLDI